MPRKSVHLAPARPCHSALLLIDLVNTWEMQHGAALRRQVLRILPNLVRLRAAAARAGAPVIFANDNFGRWRSNWPALIELARQSHRDSERIIAALAPAPSDYVVLKPEHSAFYATPLSPLLAALRAKRLILAGVSADQCVLATAGDALLRNFQVVVPRDATASASSLRQRAILRHFRTVMDVATPYVRELRWK